MFEVQISAARLQKEGEDAEYIGDVIKYEIRVSEDLYGVRGWNHVFYLDCLNAPNPSGIHFEKAVNDVATWANNKLAQCQRTRGR